MTKDKEKKIKLLEMAYNDLLELRGLLCDIYGKFNPDVPKLKKYWEQPKPQFEKDLEKL